MKILYKNTAAKKQFSSEYTKKWKYPDTVKKKLVSIENFIINADSFLDLLKYPGYHLHTLEGDRNGEWALNVGKTGYRVSLIPCDTNGNELLSGDIVSQCKSIKIVLVTGVSNHYE